MRNERKAASAMARAYGESWNRIKAQLYKLDTEYKRATSDGGEPRLNWYYQSVRAMRLQEQIARELNRFARYAGNTITAEQKRAIRESAEFAHDLVQLSMPPIPEGVAIGFNRLPVKAIETMVGMNQPGSPLTKLLSKYAETGYQEAQDALIQGIALGQNPRKIAPILRAKLGTNLNKALTISRTEVMRANRETSQAIYAANSDVIKGWRWSSALDGRTCPSCFSKHGSEHPLSERMATHPNCFPAGTMVSGPNPTAGTKRYYTGELVSIRTASGVELSLTPNHPILTWHGWVAGGLLQKGDYVIRSTGRKNAESTVDINYNDVPTLIEKVIESFDMVFVEMPTAPKDFHGDGVGSKVHIVFTNSLLGNNGNTAFDQPLFQHKFGRRSIAPRSFFTFSTITKLFPGMFHTSHGGMSRSRISLPFFRRFFTCLQEIGLRIAAYVNTLFKQTSADNVSGNSIGLGQSVLGFSSEIAVNNSSRWQRIVNTVKSKKFVTDKSLRLFSGTKLNIAFGKNCFKPIIRNVRILSEIVKAFPVEIELDEIVEINRSVFSGHVYNLQTKDEWYIANSIITHNCRCVETPITYTYEELGARYGVDLSAADKAGPSQEEILKKYGITGARAEQIRRRSMSGEDAFKSLSDTEQKNILGPAKYAAWKAGAFEFSALSVKTISPEWGEGLKTASLKDLVSPEDLEKYKNAGKK